MNLIIIELSKIDHIISETMVSFHNAIVRSIFGYLYAYGRAPAPEKMNESGLGNVNHMDEGIYIYPILLYPIYCF